MHAKRWVALVSSVLMLGCAGGGGAPRDAGGSVDAGAELDAGGGTDAGFDAGDPLDASEVLPERCNAEFEYFMDEFGRRAYCIFVSTDGDDEMGDGTVRAPFRTIAHGVEVAVAQGASTGNVHAVAVSMGTYEERLVLANGISVYGQFDADDMWSRDPGNETIVQNREVVDGRIEGVVAEAISAPTVLEGFTIDAQTALVEWRDVDVYGVRVVDSSPVVEDLGGLVLRDLTVEAGHAAAGSDGGVGAAGDPGVGGEPGDPGITSSGDGVAGGRGGAAICASVTIEATRGGTGGTSGGDDAMGCGTYREDAAPGSPPDAMPSCMGGAAGDACSCVSPIDYDGEDGGPGNTCATGAATAGAAATAATTHGEVLAGLWVASAPVDGADGAHGVGGSGGGGGGSGCAAAGYGPTGGGGGGGGSGGCAGVGGGGGSSGGSSFALFVQASEIAAPGCAFQSRNGGDGGAAAAGGDGGGGGTGGAGGSGGYAGGIGGTGQAGGGGGAGAGGVGGSSVGALICDSEVAELDLDAIAAGIGGAGGAAVPGGAAGVDGFASRVLFDCGF